MADGMSFDKYIDNPSGGATVVTSRNMYKDMYKSKFDKVLLRENGSIEWKVFSDSDGKDSYYIYFKIPSEVIEKFYYDVVVRLYTNSNVKKLNNSLREYAVEFYSNDPAFVYTFAHSFAKNRLFIKDLEPKMSRQALKNVAKQRNPKDNVWYVKSLYFAYLTMERYHLFNRSILKQRATRYDKKQLLSMITHASEKVEARRKAQEDLEAKKRRENKRLEEKNAGIQVNKTPTAKPANTTSKSKVVKTTPKTKTVAKVTAKKKTHT